MSAKFPLGQTVITPGALEQLSSTAIRESLERHERGDWGDVCEDDRRANEQSLTHGARLLSVYHTNGGTKFWIITEADRSATTILLPSEY